MLGYGSREELLQVDMARAILFRSAAAARTRPNDAGARQCCAIMKRCCGARTGCPSTCWTMPLPCGTRRGRLLQYRGLMLDITELKNFRRAAAGARLLRQDPEQHAEPDFGGGHGGADQLCQPALVRARATSSKQSAGAAADRPGSARGDSPWTRRSNAYAGRAAGGQSGFAGHARGRAYWGSFPST